MVFFLLSDVEMPVVYLYMGDKTILENIMKTVI